MSTDAPSTSMIPGMTEPLTRLLALRRALHTEQESAPSPAVARALEIADDYLFLAISYLGHTDQLYPEER